MIYWEDAMAVETIESFLSRIPLLASLKRKDRERLTEASLINLTEYPPNTILCHEGSLGDRLYIIVEGEIEIIKALGTEGQRLLRVCGPGEHLGEMCLLDHERRSASLRAKSRVWLLELLKDDFETLVSGYPHLVWLIASGISQRFRDLENKVLRELLETKHQADTAMRLLVDLSQSLPLEKKLHLKKVWESGKIELGPDWQRSGAKRKDRGQKAAISYGVPRLYIRTLGCFQVWRGESLIEKHEWKGNKPKLLLKAIISRPPKVPKEVLIEDLWPETYPKTGEANFKFVLHHLRKTLGPGLPKEFKSSYISLRGGIVSLDRELCRIDLDKFLSLSQKAEKAQDGGNLKRAQSLYNAAIELYKGDFLVEDLYVPWAALKRQEVQKRYVNMLVRLAELYQNEGNSKKAIECHTKIIEIDPLFENSYQRLILLYSQRGQRAMALKVFEDFKRYLHKEFSAQPDKLTISIYERIAMQSPL